MKRRDDVVLKRRDDVVLKRRDDVVLKRRDDVDVFKEIARKCDTNAVFNNNPWCLCN